VTSALLRRLRARHAISLLAFGVFLLLWLIRWLDRPLFVLFTRVADGTGKPTPFVDLHDILQAGACWRAGVDVYRPSACLHGVFNYSPFLLRAAYLPIGPRDTALGGVLLCLAFFTSLAFLPRPASRTEFRIQLAAALSTTVFYALDQGNFDVAIFVATVFAARLIALRPQLRCAAYLTFVLAAAAKFYPVALLVTVIREPLRNVTAIFILGIAAGAVFLGLYGPDILTALKTIPSGTPFRATFGAIDLPRGLNLLHLLTARRVDTSLAPMLRPDFSSGQTVVTLASCLLSFAALLAMFSTRKRYMRALTALDAERLLFVIAGSAVLLFCFFAAQNVYYRAIFLLLTLPGLCQLAVRDNTQKLLVAAILFLLWEAPFRDAVALIPGLRIAFWLCREGLWWWVAVEFGALNLAFLSLEINRLRREAAKFGRLKLTDR
jgi:hypothetical protein